MTQQQAPSSANLKQKTANYRVKKISFLPLSIGFLAFVIAQLFITAPAKADCTYEGTTYKTGETRGPYICSPDGTWQPKN